MKLIVEERGRTITYELDASEVTLGADLDCTVPLRDPAASPVHLRIVRRQGATFAEAVEGAGRTLYNGKPLRRARLWPGDRLTIGRTELWFETRSAGAAAPPAGSAPPAAEPAAVTIVSEPTPPELPPPPAPAPAAGGGASATSGRQPAASGRARRAAPAAGGSPAGASHPEPAEAATAPAQQQGERTAGSGPPRFRLQIISGPLAGKQIAFGRLPFRIGRNRRNHLVLQDPEVSGVHCEIAARKGGGVVLIDLDSTNGTRVNNRRVTRAALADGARIELGEHVLVFRDREAPRPGAGAPGAPAAARRPADHPKVPPPGREIVAPRPPQGAGTAEARSLEAATAALGREVAAQASGGAGPGARGLGARLAVLALLVVLGGAAAVFIGTLRPATAPAEADAPPLGNAVRNWSFEHLDAAGQPVGWRLAAPPGAGAPAPGSRLAVQQGGAAGGERALWLGPATAAAALAESAEAVAVGGREVELRAVVRAGAPAAAGPSEQGLAAAVGVAWGTSADPSLELLQLLPLSPGPHWSSARAVLLPPPGCDRARAVLLASGGPVLFDRVVLVERALPEPRRRAVEGAGVSARVGQGGVVVLERGERPLLHALVPVVLGPGAGADPLLVRPVTLWAEARALGAAPTDPSAGSGAGSAATGGTNSAGAAAAGGGQGWQIDGAALLVPAGMPIGCTAAVRPGADGTLEFSWKLGGGVPPAGRPALWLHLADAAALAELQRVPAGAQGGAADGTAASGPVRELVFGEGAAAVSLTLSPPLAVSTRRLGGGGALLLLTGPEGGTELRLEVGRSSSRARELLEQQLADAAELERQGRLEAARALYARLAREAWQPEVRTQAAQRAEALAERARAALAQAATLEQDANALGVAPLLEAAAARCRFVCEAFPGTGWAERAAQALERIELAHRRLAQQRRLQAARALYERARHQLEARRFRLGRALLQELLLAYGEVDELAARARQDLEFANAALEGRR